jgi:hypothetical protein
MNNLLRPKKKAPKEIKGTASQPFEKCALDIVGPLVKSSSRIDTHISGRTNQIRDSNLDRTLGCMKCRERIQVEYRAITWHTKANPDRTRVEIC